MIVISEEQGNILRHVESSAFKLLQYLLIKGEKLC